MNDSPGRIFYDEQVRCLEQRDIAGLMAQYAPDAVVIGFDFTVRGHEAIRDHFVVYLERLGNIKLVSTDRFTETEDSIFFEATLDTDLGRARVYDVFMLRDGKTTRQFTGVIAVAPRAFPT